MKMEVYTPDEIINVIQILESVQDIFVAEGEFISDELYDMLQEAIEILYYEDDEE